jgi:hypothetical protein
METPQYSGGFADVWKGRYNDREVAAKVLRVYLRDDFRQIRRVGSPLVVCTEADCILYRSSARRL